MFDTAAYYMVLLMAAIPALTDRNKRPSLGWVAYGFVLLLFIGLRYEVGADWEGYNFIMDSLHGQSFDELLEHGELAYNSILWSSAQMGLDIYGANLATTGVFLYGLFRYCKIQPNPWVALFSALPFLVIVVAMSANRQAAAIGVTLLVLALWDNTSAFKKMLLIFIAAAFHVSAMIFGVFVVLNSKLAVWKKVVLSSAFFWAATMLISGNKITDRYESSYIEGKSENVASGAMQQILLIAIPAVIFLVMSARNRNFRLKVPHWDILFVMSILSLALIPMSFGYSVAASRISFYMFPVSIAVLAALPEVLVAKNAAKLLVLTYGFLTLGLWLNFANTAYKWLPYNNFLFQIF
ncbi:MAG: EpsG family protein [Gallionella sp.]|nr:EpsG family protein [Gallionella sp.]MDD4946147.1 EpsG family protein [Gallionella sp.]